MMFADAWSGAIANKSISKPDDQAQMFCLLLTEGLYIWNFRGESISFTSAFPYDLQPSTR